jgi:hypothetical protein
MQAHVICSDDDKSPTPTRGCRRGEIAVLAKEKPL